MNTTLRLFICLLEFLQAYKILRQKIIAREEYMLDTGSFKQLEGCKFNRKAGTSQGHNVKWYQAQYGGLATQF